MSKNRKKNLEFSWNRTAVFFLGLLFSIGVSIALLIYLLELFSTRRTVSIPILLAGISGVIGTCLVPLVFQQNNIALTKDSNKLDRYSHSKSNQLLYPITQIILYVICGFCVAAGALVMTSALLVDYGDQLSRPTFTGSSINSNPYGIITFGGLIGFFLGLALTKNSVSWVYENLRGIEDVVSTFGDIEEEIFGEPLVNFNGYMFASWKTSSSSMIAGTLFIHMEPNSYIEYSSESTKKRFSKLEAKEIYDERHGNETSQNELTISSRILVQGGRNADVVPFAVSVISQEFDVEPQRLILAAPSEDRSENLSFKFLYPSNDVNPRKDVYTILINVNQAGRTIQLCDMEVSI